MSLSYAEMWRAVHALELELEPDKASDSYVDLPRGELQNRYDNLQTIWESKHRRGITMPIETLKIDAVSGVKSNQYGDYFSIKVGNRWINVKGQPIPGLKGNKVLAETKTSADGKYTWAKINAPEEKAPPPAAEQANGSWEHYAEMARAAHNLALELEPDREDGEDRSEARMAFVQSIIVAFREGKVNLPAEPEPPEFGPDQSDDIPF